MYRPPFVFICDWWESKAFHFNEIILISISIFHPLNSHLISLSNSIMHHNFEIYFWFRLFSMEMKMSPKY